METTTETKPEFSKTFCTKTTIRAIRDALEVINGHWKLQILVALSEGPRRFTEIAREVEGISDKMLSKELKELEMNQLVTRTVHDTFPPTVAYAVTDYMRTLDTVILSLRDWGAEHRRRLIG